jgi:serine/threonine-protein kinase RsbT
MPQNTKTPSAKCSRVERVRVPVTSVQDILRARQRAREMASEADFTALELTFIATAISELGRNILQYAGGGEVSMKIDQQQDRTVLIVVARDNGPGISDLERALKDGFSTSGGLGLGLPGVKRLMDEFEIVSHQNYGTTVIAKKWGHRDTTIGPGITARASFERRDGAPAGMLAAVGSLT